MKINKIVYFVVLMVITIFASKAFAGSGVEGVLKDISKDTTAIAAWTVGIYAFVFVVFLFALYISFKINGRLDIQRALSYLVGVVVLLVTLTIFKDTYIPKLKDTVEEIVHVETSF